MSYILDALKKSNRERNDERQDDVHIVRNHPRRSPRMGNTVFKNLGWILFFCALILIGALFSYNIIQTGRVPTSPSDGSSHIAIDKNIEVVESRDNADNILALGRNDEQQVVVANSPYARKQIKREREKKVFIVAAVEKTVRTKTETREVPSRLDLPREVQNELPDLHFAGHTYADDPSRRLIIINNEIRREGDRIDGNTTLVEIIWEGVILNYKGIVFKQKLNM